MSWLDEYLLTRNFTTCLRKVYEKKNMQGAEVAKNEQINAAE